MPISTHFSYIAPKILGEQSSFEGYIVGYAAIIKNLALALPLPFCKALVSNKNQQHKSKAWLILPNKYLPKDHEQLPKIQALYNHLVFALKYEGLNLLIFAKIYEALSQEELLALVNIEPSGQYSRRIWFLLEWVSGQEIKGKKNAERKAYIPVLEDRMHYGVKGIKSARHLVINNLPGCPSFCPLIRKTEKLEMHISKNYLQENRKELAGIRKDLIQKASAFLLLKDSKASFSIEGESPKSLKAKNWGLTISQAGLNDLSKAELLRLQEAVIENQRFVQMGYRTKGGFIGEHDQETGEPIPDHISAKAEDLEELMQGLLDTCKLLIEDDMHAVLAAASIAFGFVFIHPFQDGNGRIHRYLIQHVLAKKNFVEQGVHFPISYSILTNLLAYRLVLEKHSKSLLPYIEWEETADHNVKVMNQTKDFYRFFDATSLAEFLFDCVEDTIKNIVPQEINYLKNFESFKNFALKRFGMPERMIALFIQFLAQNNGILSNRAKQKEFAMFSAAELADIESFYASIFLKEEKS